MTVNPIRTPRRVPIKRNDKFGRHLAVVGLILAALVAGAKTWKPESAPIADESTALVSAERLASDAAWTTPASALNYTPSTLSPRAIYVCKGATGLYRQDRPCPTTADDSLDPPPPSRPERRPDPNQALLDAAEARYAREVRGAEAAGRRLDQPLGARRDGDSGSEYSCRSLCEQKARLESRMRAGYGNYASRWLHDRKNAIYLAMQAADCRACF